MMREFIEELKLVFDVRHVLYFTNIVLFVVVSFINWDLLWWWNVADWTALDRIMFLIILAAVNWIATIGWIEWKKRNE